MRKTMVSIIIVNYKVKKELFSCVKSIINSNPKTGYEIIVVDNDEVKSIKKDLLKLFPSVKYIPSEENIGYGAGINLGAKEAKGEFLFFLNPDTLVKKDAIDLLVKFLQQNHKVGVVAPLLLDSNEDPYALQGTLELTPKRAIFAHSFINKIFPNNFVSKKFWQIGWDKGKNHSVDVVPGTALMISKKLFEKVGGFDERFFLYFEENDLCKKVKNLGHELTILANAKVIHFWEVSTKQRSDISEIFSKSRFYYFKKNYGFVNALLVNFVLGLNKYSAAIILILALFLFVSTYDLKNSMTFIGDQGWFYLSARDFLFSGKFPLVGITSSHTWIHQGPIWTYMLAIVMKVFGFNPVYPGYLSIILNAACVYLIYNLGRRMFNNNVGIIGALFYATSPLVIQSSRMPYHTSPIPLLSLLTIYCVYKWVRGKTYYFPLIIFFLALLYNFELAAFILVIPVAIILGLGVIKRQEWAVKLIRLKIIGLSLFGFLIPMLPFLIYDTTHGYPQTLKFIAWLGYKFLGFLGFLETAHESIFSPAMINFTFSSFSKLIFANSYTVAILIVLFSLTVLMVKTYKEKKAGNLFSTYFILLLFIVVPFIGYFINRTPSDAYLPMFFPGLILMVAIYFDWLIMQKNLRYIAVLVILLISVLNLNYMFNGNFLLNSSFKQKVVKMDELIAMTGGEKYKIAGKGPGSKFESFTMNYEYLLWWKGHAPVKQNTDIIFTIEENRNGITVYKTK